MSSEHSSSRGSSPKKRTTTSGEAETGSGFLANWRTKVSASLGQARQDLHRSLTKSLTATASSMATSGNAEMIAAAGGSKTRLFGRILERAKQQRSDLAVGKKRAAGASAIEFGTVSTAITTSVDPRTGISRDELQQRLARYSQLEQEYGALLDAYELMFVERVHLEELLSQQNHLESIDDMETVGHYLRNLQESNLISKREIVRLTDELKEFKALQSGLLAKEYCEAQVETAEPETITSHLELAECSSCKFAKVQLEEQKETCDNLKRKLLQFSEEAERNTSTMVKLNQSLSTAMGERQRLLIELEESKKIYKNLHDKCRLSEEKYQEAICQLEIARQQVDRSNEKTKIQTDQIRHLQSEVKSLQKSLEELSHVQNTKTSIDWNQEATRFLNQNALLDFERIKSENERLEDCLNKERQVNCDMQLQCDKLSNELILAEKIIEGLHKDLDNYKNLMSKNNSAVSLLTMISRNSNRDSRRNSADTTIKGEYVSRSTALEDELASLARENQQLKNSFNFEYARNVVLRYLQLPNQRKWLVQVLCELFKISIEEASQIHQ